MNTDWNDLIQRYMAGQTTETEMRRLEATLKADDDLADLYLRHMELDTNLEAQATYAEATRELLATPWVDAPKRDSFAWLSWHALAAAAVMLLVMATWLAFGRDERFAELIEVQQARWESSTLPTEPGSRLSAGRLRLAEGLATLRFARGADVTLEGPAELELIGPQLCRLHRGSLVAHVPEPARGFSVLTPSATLIDHGTDFGLSTDEKGHANVQVMQGEVELRHASGAPPLRLTTREMAAITPEKLLPAMPMQVEPRRSEADTGATAFIAEVSTRTGRGAAAYVSEPRTGDNQSSMLLLLKHCAEPGYGRKAILRFDLTALPDVTSLHAAQLTFSLSPSGYGYASHSDDARVVVYALTDDADDFWSAAAVHWDTQPAFDPSAGRVDESKAMRVGEFIVPRGVQTGLFSLESPLLIERIKADPNRLLTLILVRENRIEQGGGLVLGIAGNRHPTLPPPTLRVR